jgi:hypothetical protein
LDSTDLESALNFVIERIKEQAVQSGDPLTHEQLALLRNLPIANGSTVVGGTTPSNLIPRDLNYERLCAVGKAAYAEASKQDPEKLEWELASAVFLFHNHPMWGLLFHAGVRNQRPGWDPLLMVFWAVVLIVTLVGTAFELEIHFERSAVTWSAVCAELIPLALLTRWGVRRTQRLRFEYEVDRCRMGLNPGRHKQS